MEPVTSVITLLYEMAGWDHNDEDIHTSNSNWKRHFDSREISRSSRTFEKKETTRTKFELNGAHDDDDDYEDDMEDDIGPPIAQTNIAVESEFLRPSEEDCTKVETSSGDVSLDHMYLLEIQSTWGDPNSIDMKAETTCLVCKQVRISQNLFQRTN